MIMSLDAATRPAAPDALSLLPDSPINRVAAAQGLSGLEWTAPVRRGEAASPVGSIAVLAFTDLSQNKDQEFFCDGMTEELRATLARLLGLRVACRTSATAYKGRAVDALTVGRELDVAAVLARTAQQIGARLRIPASLIGTADGFQLWCESFDSDTADIFAVEDDLARSVATSLVPDTTSNVEAYQLDLCGRHFRARREFDGLQRAVECYWGSRVSPIVVRICAASDWAGAMARSAASQAASRLALDATILSSRDIRRSLIHRVTSRRPGTRARTSPREKELTSRLLLSQTINRT
jgi:TolB-like protein